MWIIIALLVIGIIATIISGYLVKKNIQQYNGLQASINTAQYEVNQYKEKLEQLTVQDNELTNQIVEHRFKIDELATRKKELNDDIATQVENVEKLKQSYELTEEEFKKKYLTERQVWIDKRQEEYIQMQEDFAEQFKDTNRRKMDAAKELDKKLSELKSAASAAVEVAKRHAEEENFIKFHSLQMGPHTLNDIRRLEEIVPSISQEAGEAIAKVIWKVYYEKPYTDLVGRVIGNGRHTGIYRITNIETQMCYVGQAVDIADRWRQHIKRALNAEPRTQNKLYPAMYQEGLEKFTFEVIEECDQSKLNEREDYWQDFYKAKEYGYSIK